MSRGFGWSGRLPSAGVAWWVDQTESGGDMAGVPLPEGYHSVNPYIVVDGAEGLIQFLVDVFGAKEIERELRSDGRIEHGEVRIGDSIVMVSEATERYPARPCVQFAYLE